MQYAALTCSYTIALVFAVACVSKLYRASAFREYREAVRGYLPLTGFAASGFVVTAIAVGAIVAEAAVPVLIAVPRLAEAGLVLAIVLLIVFTGAMSRALRSGLRVACRCFGAASRPPSRSALARNGVLLVVAGAGVVAQWAGVPSVPAGGVALCLMTAVVVATLLIFFDDLVSVVVSTG
jgi:hypothetical protein